MLISKQQNHRSMRKLKIYFEKTFKIPQIKVGKKQKIETLINEEALLLAKYLRDEKKLVPRIAKL